MAYYNGKNYNLFGQEVPDTSGPPVNANNWINSPTPATPGGPSVIPPNNGLGPTQEAMDANAARRAQQAAYNATGSPGATPAPGTTNWTAPASTQVNQGLAQAPPVAAPQMQAAHPYTGQMPPSRYGRVGQWGQQHQQPARATGMPGGDQTAWTRPHAGIQATHEVAGQLDQSQPPVEGATMPNNVSKMPAKPKVATGVV